MPLRKLLKGITCDTEASNGNLLRIRYSTEEKSAGRANFYSQTVNFVGQSIAQNVRYQADWRAVSHEKWDTGPQYRRNHVILGWLARQKYQCVWIVARRVKHFATHQTRAPWGRACTAPIALPMLVASTVFSSIFLRNCTKKRTQRHCRLFLCSCHCVACWWLPVAWCREGYMCVFGFEYRYLPYDANSVPFATAR